MPLQLRPHSAATHAIINGVPYEQRAPSYESIEAIPEVNPPQHLPQQQTTLGDVLSVLPEKINRLRSDAELFWKVREMVGTLSNESYDVRQDLRNRICSYSQLQRDWKETENIAPSQRAIDDALRFLDLIPANAVPPRVAPAGDGEISFFWKQSGLYLDVGFRGNGEIHYYARRDDIALDDDDCETFAGASLPRSVLFAIPTD